jgi:hypothetical protein
LGLSPIEEQDEYQPKGSMAASPPRSDSNLSDVADSPTNRDKPMSAGPIVPEK